MKIRIISDLHLDYNANHKLDLQDKEVFTIICGDISAYFDKTSKWINKNLKKGVFVEGNHIFYNESKHSLQHFLHKLSTHYPLTNDVTFLNNNYKIIDDIVFVGGILWTDYKLFGSGSKDMSKWFATKCLNDFRYGKVNFGNDIANEKPNYGSKIDKLTPDHCEKMFDETFAYINKVCKQFKDKKIVVVTHHAPSIQSLPDIYKNNESSPCYASNLEEFILDNPNIRLWCHRHTHSPSDYTIGETRIICNPRGYVRYGENKHFNENLIVEI